MLEIKECFSTYVSTMKGDKSTILQFICFFDTEKKQWIAMDCTYCSSIQNWVYLEKVLYSTGRTPYSLAVVGGVVEVCWSTEEN